jgi:TRAP transporter 4TM/12TM fusion protein
MKGEKALKIPFLSKFSDTKKEDYVLKRNADGTIDGEEILRDRDQESSFRKLLGSWKTIVMIVSCIFIGYQMITARIGTPIYMKHLGIHLGFILFLIFTYYPATKKSDKEKPTLIDIGLMLITVAATVYTVYNVEPFNLRSGVALMPDYIFGAITCLLVLEATRRVVGNSLVILAAVFLIYAYFGRYFPGVLNHRGYNIERIIYQMYLTGQGIFGIPLSVSAGYLVVFIVLAALLDSSGLGKLFNDAALAIGGRTVGGPAKVSVIASALCGTISGSAATNVATTGAFTIPLMKKCGYKAYFAGAVEAAASTGGQIMPPIMGTVAFIMAEYLGVSYGSIAMAAIIPALLYFSGVFFQVDIRARKIGLKGLSKEEIPNLMETIKKYGHMIIPMIVLVYFLMDGFSPVYAAFYASVITWVLSLLRKETRLLGKGLVDMCVKASRSALSVGIAMATAGFIVAVLSMTGIGVILADNIVLLSGGHLFIALLLTMIVSIILGMGLPTSACYIIASSISVPILTKMGVAPFQAHFFVLYFSVISTVTPPVALASYVAAGMSGASTTKVGYAAFRLALAAFIIPFFFIYNPAMLLIADSSMTIVWATITALFGTYLLALALEGYFLVHLPMWTRFISFVAAILLMTPGLSTDLIGAALVAIMGVTIFIIRKKNGVKETLVA